MSLFVLCQGSFGFAEAMNAEASTDAALIAPSEIEDPIYIDSTRSASTSIRAKKRKENSPASNYEYSINLEYQAMTDIASQASPQAFLHVFDVDASLNVFKTFDVGINAGIKYVSLGGDIPQDSIEASDVTLKTSYSKRLTNILSLKTGLVTSLPTSDAAKVDGYEAIETGFLEMNIRVVKGIYNIVNSVAAGYIFNRYNYSPGTLLSNPNSYGQYELVNVLRMNRFMSFDFGVGGRVSHTLDGTNTIHFENQEALNFKYRQWHVTLSYSNGTYADQSDIDLWFVDQYRQILGFGIVYEI